MSTDKTANVCMTCRHFNDDDSLCQRFPPSVRVTTKDEFGHEESWWVQPTIDLEWSTTCGEWAADRPQETSWQRVERVGRRINEWKESHKDDNA